MNTPANQHSQIIFVVGQSGSGRTTALNAFEDFGFLRIDNLPLEFVVPFVNESHNTVKRRVAIGIAPSQTEDVEQFIQILGDQQMRFPEIAVLYLFADSDILIRRYSESRRRHPYPNSESLRESIEREGELIDPIRDIAYSAIETTDLTPHQLKSKIGKIFGISSDLTLTVNIESFAYKHGLPTEADLVLDCRFLKNPHWDEALRPHNGTNRAVQDYIKGDANFQKFYDDISSMLDYIIPAVEKEGRSYFTIAFGCTGGRHRSVFMTELISCKLLGAGWDSQITHRELARLGEIEGVDL